MSEIVPYIDASNEVREANRHFCARQEATGLVLFKIGEHIRNPAEWEHYNEKGRRCVKFGVRVAFSDFWQALYIIDAVSHRIREMALAQMPLADVRFVYVHNKTLANNPHVVAVTCHGDCTTMESWARAYGVVGPPRYKRVLDTTTSSNKRALTLEDDDESD